MDDIFSPPPLPSGPPPPAGPGAGPSASNSIPSPFIGETPLVSLMDGDSPLSRLWLSDDEERDLREGRAVEMPTTQEKGEWSDIAERTIIAALAHPDVTEVHGSAYNRLFVRYQGRYWGLRARFDSPASYNSWLRRQVEESESVYDWEKVTAARRGVLQMADGHSLTLVLPPFSPDAKFSVRKRTSTQWRAEDIVARGSMAGPMIEFLRACVRAKVNILLVGGVGSGKTSLLSILSRDIGASERVAVIQEVEEITLAPELTDYYVYQPLSPGLGLPEVLDSNLYQRYDRTIVGEVHWVGLTNMLEVWTSLTMGSMSTYHAPSAERAVERMIVSVQRENPQMSRETAIGLIRDGVEVIVALDRTQGVHRCMQIAEVDWRSSVGATNVAMSTLFGWVGDGQGGHWQVGHCDPEGRVRQKMRTYGVPYREEWFLTPRLMPAGTT